MKTVTKRDLVVQISNETGMTQQQVFDVIQKTLDTITAALAGGDEVVLRNFGSFQIRETKQKIGRNPNKPGTDVIIPPRSIVKFKPGKEMKERAAAVLPRIQNRGAQEVHAPSPDADSV
jgi:nucleoid DNA-binding protein